MRKKGLDKKFLWIVILCMLVISVLYAFYVIDSKKRYNDTFNHFQQALLESKKKHVKEIVNRAAYEIDVKRTQYDQVADHFYHNIEQQLDTLIRDKPAEDVIYYVSCLIACDDNETNGRYLIWDRAEQQVLFSKHNEEIKNGHTLTEQQLKAYIDELKYAVVKSSADERYVIIVGSTEEDIDAVFKDHVLQEAEKSRQKKNEGYIYIYPYVREEALCHPFGVQIQEIVDKGEAYDTHYHDMITDSYDEKLRVTYSMYSPKYQWIIARDIDVEELQHTIEAEETLLSNELKEQIKITVITMIALFVLAGGAGLVLINYHEWRKKRFMHEKDQLLKQHYAILEDKHDKMNAILHDIKNHLICIYGLAAQESNQDALQYIRSVQADIDKLGYIVISGNKVIDILLNERLRLMRDSGIECHYEFEAVDLTFVSNKDLVTMVSNLMDNAIEACGKSEMRQIAFKLYSYHQFIVLKLTNSCDHKPKRKGKWIISTKNRSEYHGYGMKNISDTVHKYGGEMTWSYDEPNRQFQVVIMLPKS